MAGKDVTKDWKYGHLLANKCAFGKSKQNEKKAHLPEIELRRGLERKQWRLSNFGSDYVITVVCLAFRVLCFVNGATMNGSTKIRAGGFTVWERFPWKYKLGALLLEITEFRLFTLSNPHLQQRRQYRIPYDNIVGKRKFNFFWLVLHLWRFPGSPKAMILFWFSTENHVFNPTST